MFSILNPTALLITALTGVSVLVHDTKIDKATVTALTAPAIVAVGYAAATNASYEVKISSESHVHVEKATENLRRMVAAEPRLQTRNTDDKKYLDTKKASLNNNGDDNTLVFIPNPA